MLICVVGTCFICAPLALAVHRLAAARLGALLQSIRVGAGIPVVQSRLAHPVHATSLILVVCINVVALIVCVPCTHAVHRLGASAHRAFFVAFLVRATLTIKCWLNLMLIMPAFHILMSFVIMLACPVIAPRSNTIKRLFAKKCRAYFVRIWPLAAISII